jgi:hypothetical protein
MEQSTMQFQALPSTLRRASLVLAALSLAACASGGIPDKTATRPGGAGTGSAGGSRNADQIALAADLASHGYRTNSPLSLVAAAQILIDNPPAAFTATPAEGAAATGSKPGTPIQLDAQRLLTAAQNMARDNTNISALVSQLQQRASAGARGAIGGAKAGRYSVPAGATHTFTIDFYGNEVASVRIRGDGDTDLDCFVYNSSGQLVAVDNDGTDYCILDWYPRWAGSYRIVVRNLGSVYNVYQIITN